MMGKSPLFRPTPPSEPAGKVNVTDPDSQLVKSLHGWVQGYTAQAAATPEQIIVATDVITSGNERNRLEPTVDQVHDELAAAGVTKRPEVVLADAGFFNLGQIDRLRRRGLRPLVSPDASRRSKPGLTRAANRPISRCAMSSSPTTAATSTGGAHKSASRSSRTPSACGAPTASNAADYAPAGPSGD
jgi:hypothetical protein